MLTFLVFLIDSEVSCIICCYSACIICCYSGERFPCISSSNKYNLLLIFYEKYLLFFIFMNLCFIIVHVYQYRYMNIYLYPVWKYRIYRQVYEENSNILFFSPIFHMKNILSILWLLGLFSFWEVETFYRK